MQTTRFIVLVAVFWIGTLLVALRATPHVSPLTAVAYAADDDGNLDVELTAVLAAAGFTVEHVEPDDYRWPWAKGLVVDLGPLLRPRGQPEGSWELNAPGRALARVLSVLSPWAACAGILFVTTKSPNPS